MTTEGRSPSIDAACLLDAVPDPVVLIVADGTLLWGNAAAVATFGWTVGDWAGRSASELVHPDDWATAVASLESVSEKTAGTLVEIRVRDHTGVYRRAEVRGGSAPGVDGVVLVVRDLTDRRRWELAGGDHAALSAVLDALPTMAFVLTPDGRIRSANRAFTRLLGHPLEESLDRPLTDFVTIASTLVLSDQLVVVADGPGRVSFEVEMLAADGSTRLMSLTIVDMADDGAVDGLVATATDIGDLVSAREQLRHAATHDELTGLPNRWLLSNRIDAALESPHLVGRVGLIFLDIDRFKEINDRHGHAVGDAVLVEVAARLVDAVRDSDTVARFGGDEFLVLTAAADDAGIERIVDRLHWSMRPPVQVSDLQGDGEPTFRLHLSIGWVVAAASDTADGLVARADAAMYRSKLRRRADHR
ncbi:MAG: sensor domain-containing diguanylate cyclase [Acidimicrobiia bacterium]|nr:sensor domain-containing diguanylate cyclase [Acidimicrobiia bacterium]